MEYGISTQADAERLLQVATPDWLIAADCTASDPSIESAEFQRGMETLLKSVPKEKIIWATLDPWLQAHALDSALGVDAQSIATGSCVIAGQNFGVDRELLGQSAAFAAGAAAILATRLGMPGTEIDAFLSPNASK